MIEILNNNIQHMKIWHIEFIIPDKNAIEIFTKALGDFSFSSSAFEIQNEGGWRLALYCHKEPDNDQILARITFASQMANIKEPEFSTELLPQTDWVSENQKSFKPIKIKRFFIYPSHYDGIVPAGSWPMEIDASTAFGTGNHGTTEGCLLALNDLAKYKKIYRPLDIGCGTGILSMAMARAWPVNILATDIDKKAVIMTRYNIEKNKLKGRIRVELSKGFDNSIIKNNGAYDLIMANILANPLRHMAKDMISNLQIGGMVILSGLLNNQESLVINAYMQQGVYLKKCYRLNGWSTLVMS